MDDKDLLISSVRREIRSTDTMLFFESYFKCKSVKMAVPVTHGWGLFH